MIRIPIDSHHFYTIGPYYIIGFQPIPGKRRVELIPMDVNCMFNIYKMERKGKFLGLAFRTASTVINAGAYLMARMNNRGRKPDLSGSTVLMRTPDIVIYNYPNLGTLAVSPVMNSQMTALLEEQ